MSTVIQLNEEVARSLEPFRSIVNFDRTVPFINTSPHKLDDCEKPNVVPFNCTKFKDSLKWFNYLFNLAESSGLSKQRIHTIVSNSSPCGSENKDLFIIKDPTINDIRSLQRVLMRRWFHKGELTKVMVHLTSGRYDRTSYSQMLIEFKKRIRTYVQACVIFDQVSVVSFPVMLANFLKYVDDSVAAQLNKKIVDIFTIDVNTAFHLLEDRGDIGTVNAIRDVTQFFFAFGKEEGEVVPSYKNTIKCACCGKEEHYKSQCKFLHSKCNKCNMKDLLEAVCQKIIIKGKDDKNRGFIRPTKKGCMLNLEYLNTPIKHVRCMPDCVNGYLPERERLAARQRARYQEKKRIKTGPEVNTAEIFYNLLNGHIGNLDNSKLEDP